MSWSSFALIRLLVLVKIGKGNNILIVDLNDIHAFNRLVANTENRRSLIYHHFSRSLFCKANVSVREGSQEALKPK